MCAALVWRQCVDFVDDHRARRGQHRAAGFRTEQDVQRLRRSHDDVRRAPAHLRALGLRRIAGTHTGADFHIGQTEFEQLVADAGERRFQIYAHIVRQRLQRRDIDDEGFVRQRRLDATAHEFIDRGQEGGDRLARARGCRDQRMTPGLDRRPGAHLRGRRCGKCAAKPRSNGRVEVVERHGRILLRLRRERELSAVHVSAGETASNLAKCAATITHNP